MSPFKIGERIRNLRLSANLTQEELAERAGLTKGFISQIERDITSISVDSLADILKALNQTLASFFSEYSEPKIVFTMADRRVVKKPGIYDFEYLIHGAPNRHMDPVLCTLDPGEETLTDDPHDGDEFGYVLQGRIEVILGDKSYRVKKDECFYYACNRVHKIQNNGKSEATFLWISSPPYF